MRKNAMPNLKYVQGKFCQFVQRIEKDGKETLEMPLKNTPLNQCILIEYTGTYEAFYESGSLELIADFKNGFLDGRFIHYSASFKKIREFRFLRGEKHGLATHYYPDERLNSKTPWYQGMRDGNVLRYSEDLNQKITTYSYKEGKIYEISK
jgi:antitoxin component YwqK of YwqJK toxin-antitoxin module